MRKLFLTYSTSLQISSKFFFFHIFFRTLGGSRRLQNSNSNPKWKTKNHEAKVASVFKKSSPVHGVPDLAEDEPLDGSGLDPVLEDQDVRHYRVLHPASICAHIWARPVSRVVKGSENSVHKIAAMLASPALFGFSKKIKIKLRENIPIQWKGNEIQS